MSRRPWPWVLVALLLLGGCASWPAAEPGDRQDDRYERGGSGGY